MVYLKSKSAEEAFKLVGAELRYLYDFFFTKMPIHHFQGKVSLLLRAFCFLCAVSSLLASIRFADKSVHAKVDIFVTYMLFLGVICLDIYSFIMHAISTWTMVNLPIRENKVHKFYSKVVAWRLHLVETEMAITSMAQLDLINYYLEARRRHFDISYHLQNYHSTNWKTFDSELKQFIYSHLVKKRLKWEEKGFELDVLEKLLNGKAEIVEELGIYTSDLELNTTDFKRRIFVWHFATELVYYDDIDRFRRDTPSPGSFCQISRSLSDYMMYLVLVPPLMLPVGLRLDDVINKEIHVQARKFFPLDLTRKMRKADFTEVRKILTSAVIGYNNYIPEETVLITGGSSLNQTLRSFISELHCDHEERWETICKVWMEMLVHAASQ